MIDFTPYTIMNGILISNIFIILFLMFSKNNLFVSKLHPKFLLLTITIIIMRLVLPVESVFFTKPIDSFVIIPYFVEILNSNRSFTIFVDLYTVNYTIIGILLSIWLLISLFLIYKHIFSYVKFTHKLKNIDTTTNDKVLNCLSKIIVSYNYKFPVRVIVSTSVPNPCEFGLFKQTILLPEYDYSHDELYFILLHELSHFANKTNWIKLASSLLTSLFWWNPLIYLFNNAINTISEMSCDSHIINEAETDDQIKIEYIQCLINSIKAFNEKYKSQWYINTFIRHKEKKLLIRRLDFIYHSGRPDRFIRACVFLIFLFLELLSYKFVLQPAYHPTSIDMAIPIFNEVESYIIKAEERYFLYHNGELIFELKGITDNFENLPIIYQ